MPKVIQKPNGERIIVGNDVPEDIQYDEGSLDLHLASSIIKRQKNQAQDFILNPVSLLLTFPQEEYPVVPIHLTQMKKYKTKIVITGTMLTSDYAWMLEQDIQKIKTLSIDLEHKRFNLEYGTPYQIYSFTAKDINAVGVTLNLSLFRTT
jgi:hypothetical protein